MNAKSRIKRGDTVITIAGRDRGKRGRVLRVYPAEARALVEGINLVTKAMRANPQKGTEGGLIKKEATIELSNIMLFCPGCQRGVRATLAVSDDGARQRLCKKCDNVL